MDSEKKVEWSECTLLFETLFERISNKIDAEISILDEKLKKIEETIEDRICTLEQKLFKSLRLDDETDTFVELRKEIISIEQNEVIRNLKFRDSRSIVNLFRKYYYKKENRIHKYPIKIKGKRSYQYYVNGMWHQDLNGHYIINTICWIFENLFMGVNNINNIPNYQEMVDNQNFIYKISTDKFKKELFKNIIEEVELSL
jgi:hypothetical protein